ncbi:class I SAM-dependent methyltransferase [Dactylosporangium sp. AC04546]|uniref:class I SAM-dependent methyltransferase n=1 Tax=Dactylosporangium sp. AC04546 TaxID=2862460 RepID=UPI002E7AECA9|nr:class I SAM-dependent methyltransferase [Dactylosporangium sp. AC04546]WVK86493.1 class I SAM-dependent methyltransferase [Dactylosporangium sp. AC04546]
MRSVVPTAEAAVLTQHSVDDTDGSAAYGDDWAEVYDALYDGRDDLAGVVQFIARWARPASVLELGVGTGRLALPLSAAGLRVVGVDASPAMLDRLRAKAGAERVEARLGDMCEPPADEVFGCVLIAFSTLFLLPDQAAQRRCLRAAADRLAPGGALIVEGFIPDPNRWHNGHSLHVERWQADQVVMTAGRLDPAAQTIETLRVAHTPHGTRVIPNRLRYVLPAELDLLAECAGLRLAGRYGDLTGSALPELPSTAVSVYTALPPRSEP